MHVHELIRTQHNEAKDAYEQYLEAQDPKRKEELGKEILTGLTVHAEAEEEIYYPELEKAGHEALVKEFRTEHTGAKAMIAKLSLMTPGTDTFDGGLRSLMAAILAHVTIEEETAMPKVEQQVPASTLEEIGTKMEERSKELRESTWKRMWAAIT